MKKKMVRVKVASPKKEGPTRLMKDVVRSLMNGQKRFFLETKKGPGGWMTLNRAVEVIGRTRTFYDDGSAYVGYKLDSGHTVRYHIQVTK